jgi:cyclophilin family peptidyl-prolyl cis-trans isomerase
MQARHHPLLGLSRRADSAQGIRLRSRRRLAMGALVLAVGLAGCGGDDGVTSTQDAEGTAEDASDVGSSEPDDTEATDPDEAGDADAADDGDDADTGDDVDASEAGSADRYDAAPEVTIDADADYQVRVETSLGVIEADLFAQEAPVTVNSFVFLARDGYFDGLTFHRVIPGFVAQGGDPRGDGTGGPGYAFEDELEVAEREGYGLGTLAMANSGPDTNGSQFFFTVDEVDLPPLYSVFGQVTSGLEVLEAIASQPTDPADRPVDDVRIITVEVDGP